MSYYTFNAAYIQTSHYYMERYLRVGSILACTTGDVESCAKANNMLTLVLRCCPDPIPPTYLCRQPSARECPVRVTTSLADFNLYKHVTKLTCSVYSIITFWCYWISEVETVLFEMYELIICNICANDTRKIFLFLTNSQNLIDNRPIKTILCHFCHKLAFSDNLWHSSQSFPRCTAQDWVGTSQCTLQIYIYIYMLWNVTFIT